MVVVRQPISNNLTLAAKGNFPHVFPQFGVRGTSVRYGGLSGFPTHNGPAMASHRESRAMLRCHLEVFDQLSIVQVSSYRSHVALSQYT